MHLLPRRIRQASLVPQLRDSRVPGPATLRSDFAAAAEAFDDHSPSDRALDDRSPEQARSTVAAIQQGWERGRSVFDAGEKGAGTTGPGTVGEGDDPGAGDDPEGAGTPDALVTQLPANPARAAGTPQSND